VRMDLVGLLTRIGLKFKANVFIRDGFLELVFFFNGQYLINISQTQTHQLRKTATACILTSHLRYTSSLYSFTKVSEHEELRCTKKLRWPKGENTKYNYFYYIKALSISF